MSVPGANAPSESVFSDTGLVTGGRRARTSDGWAETQVKVHRNYDFVKKIREIFGVPLGEPLESFWEMK